MEFRTIEVASARAAAEAELPTGESRASLDPVTTRGWYECRDGKWRKYVWDSVGSVPVVETRYVVDSVEECFSESDELEAMAADEAAARASRERQATAVR